MKELTHDQLAELLAYEEATGDFYWKVSRGRVQQGRKAGSIGTNGYRNIKLLGQDYRAHRLAWFFVHGVWPSKEIDHINRKKDDNRIANLREATRQQNSFNRSHNSNNTSGLRGVSWNTGSRKWLAQIRYGGISHHLGVFDSKEEAHMAYCRARDLHHKQSGN